MSQFHTSTSSWSSSPLSTLLTDSQLFSLQEVARETGVGGCGTHSVTNLDHLTVLRRVQNFTLYHCRQQDIELTEAKLI